MVHPFARVVLWLDALAFLGFGVAFLVAPVAMAAFVELGAESPIARVEVRAMYGGLELGIGAFLLACALRPSWTMPGLVAGTSMFAGLGGVRLLSALATGSLTSMFAGFVAFELGSAAMTGLALKLQSARAGGKGQ